jgi:hypothetical protein
MGQGGSIDDAPAAPSQINAIKQKAEVNGSDADQLAQDNFGKGVEDLSRSEAKELYGQL